jgi:methylthioribose-1-phosphate isomerase
VPEAATPTLASVRWDTDAIVIIDQRRLPAQLVEWRLTNVADVVEAIATLAVRGAPAIGIASAYGLVIGLDEARPGSAREAIDRIRELEETIGGARPTAVNLRAALARVRAAVAAGDLPDAAAVRAAALAEAAAIHDEDRAACSRIGEHGRALLAGRRRILTHCNTGRLATAGDGTALAIVYALQAAGEQPSVLVTESRPLLQGARLTAWELQASGVDVRLIVDSAAAAAMGAGLVDVVLVGCDRVAANGDTANKIGTYQLALLARQHGIPFFVAGPLSSFDPETPGGSGIPVEERSPDEVRLFAGQPSSPPDVPVWNPAFDVTPAHLIDAFVTEVGVIRPPSTEAIRAATKPGRAVAARADAATTELPGDAQAVVAGPQGGASR